MQSDNPAFLPVGTEVSAKFSGAFCEAVIQSLTKNIKIKVRVQNSYELAVISNEDVITKNGKLEVNEPIRYMQQGKKVKGVIQHVKDCSRYHVVFNDGDEKEVKRTHIRLKGAKHFEADVSLNSMPLYNPDHFSKTVKVSKKRKSEESEKRRSSRSSTEKIDESDVSSEIHRPPVVQALVDEEAFIKKEIEDDEVFDERSSQNRSTLASNSHSNAFIAPNPEQFAVGSCVVVFCDTQAATKIRSHVATSSSGSTLPLLHNPIPSSVYPIFYEKKWYPAVVVSSLAYRRYEDEDEVADETEITIRRFSNGQYLMKNVARMIPFNWLPSFSRKKMAELSELWSEEKDEVNFADAMDYVYEYINDGTLPDGWTHKEIEGVGSSPRKDVKVEMMEEENKEDSSSDSDSSDESGSSSSSDDSDDPEEAAENRRIVNERKQALLAEKTTFLKKLYQFHEERSTPIIRTPVMAGKAIDLFELKHQVRKHGGANKVTHDKAWITILRKLNLHRNPGATTQALKKAFARYLEPLCALENDVEGSADDIEKSLSEKRRLSREGSFSIARNRKNLKKKYSSRELFSKSKSPASTSSKHRNRNESFGSDFSGKTGNGWSQQSNEGSVVSVRSYPGKKRKSAIRGEEVLENYQMCNCLSIFEIGQSVLAFHDGSWYDARVTEVKQPPLDELMKTLLFGEDADSLTEEDEGKLSKMMDKYMISVHYTGWNSRYDESLRCGRLMVTNEDQRKARKALLTHPEGRRLTPTKIALAEWSSSAMDKENDTDFPRLLQEVEMIAVKVREEEEGKKENVRRALKKAERKDVTVEDNQPVVPSKPKDPIPLNLDSPIVPKPVEEAPVLNTKPQRWSLNPPPLPGRHRLSILPPVLSGPITNIPDSAPKLTMMTPGSVPLNTSSYDQDSKPPVLKVESGPLEKLVEASKAQGTPRQVEGEKATAKPLMVKAIALDCSGPITLSNSPLKCATSSTSNTKNEFKRKLVKRAQEEVRPKEKKVMKPSELVLLPVRTDPIAETLIGSEKVDKIVKIMNIEEIPPLVLPPVAVACMESNPPVLTPTVTLTPEDWTTPTMSCSSGTPKTSVPAGRGSGSGRKRGGRRGGRTSKSSDRRSSTNSLKMSAIEVQKFDHDSRFSDVGNEECGGKQDTFQTMKNRMYWEMKEENSLNDITLLGMPTLEETLKNTSPDDLMDVLEKRCEELRDTFTECKWNVVQGEKKKKQHDMQKLTENQKSIKTPSDEPQPSPSATCSNGESARKAKKVVKQRGSDDKRKRGRKRKVNMA